jgi:methionine-gamma-lyase
MKRSHSSGNKDFNPETLALGYGYDPWLSEGAIKPPVFLTSTFQFHSAAEGKGFFELAYGLRNKRPGEQQGLIYSRLNNPNLEMFEQRMAAWDRTDKGAVFASGMAAIATTAVALLQAGDRVVASAPVYGGTHYLLEHVLDRFGIHVSWAPAGNDTAAAMRSAAQASKEPVRLLFVETPANPSLEMVDIAAVRALADELGDDGAPPVVAVDNTLLGPVFQRPADFGADLVLYSATKFIGGHSDLVAGLVTGRSELLDKIMLTRAIKSAASLARLLRDHPRVRRVHHPSQLKDGSAERELYERQCTGAGSLIAFEIDGDEAAAFRVLDRFEVAHLAVSLGGTETLVEHPRSMTHADVAPEELDLLGVGDNMIRMSVGLEHLSDLKRDLRHALDGIG